jgi:hypothetical protein
MTDGRRYGTFFAGVKPLLPIAMEISAGAKLLLPIVYARFVQPFTPVFSARLAAFVSEERGCAAFLQNRKEHHALGPYQQEGPCFLCSVFSCFVLLEWGAGRAPRWDVHAR